ncbi:hypothetical protein PI125_g22306 [Phytophthora idaei]|nr:hypothetical protein PI125_g22306 [Phytophthora idaei]KAG3130476.1 hypothetical protein PI126_g20487 [Phytophthora idaei]
MEDHVVIASVETYKPLPGMTKGEVYAAGFIDFYGTR